MGIDLAGTCRRLDMPFEDLRPTLLRFPDRQRKTLDGLRGAVASGDAAGTRQHAHALAGAAGNLGADGLYEAARALEFAASRGNRDLGRLFREVEEHAGVVFQSIESLRPQHPGAEAPPVALLPPADLALLRARLERLRSALDEGDLSGSSEVLQEIAALCVPDGVRAQIVRLQEFMNGYEYDEAAQTVDRLLASSSGGEAP
jgi:HPt (histidine-containing phosphotransfer) domain-containing protein